MNYISKLLTFNLFKLQGVIDKGSAVSIKNQEHQNHAITKLWKVRGGASDHASPKAFIKFAYTLTFNN